jgi:hypothetical protein
VACDVVVTEGGRLTVVFDVGQEITEAALIQGGHLFLQYKGQHFHLGELLPSVLRQAIKCTFAMFVIMNETSVSSSTEIRLQIDE